MAVARWLWSASIRGTAFILSLWNRVSSWWQYVPAVLTGRRRVYMAKRACSLDGTSRVFMAKRACSLMVQHGVFMAKRACSLMVHRRVSMAKRACSLDGTASCLYGKTCLQSSWYSVMSSWQDDTRVVYRAKRAQSSWNTLLFLLRFTNMLVSIRDKIYNVGDLCFSALVGGLIFWIVFALKMTIMKRSKTVEWWNFSSWSKHGSGSTSSEAFSQ